MLKNILKSYWIERVIFIIGAVLLFFAEQIISNYVENSQDDIEFYKINIEQLQNREISRMNWLNEYNRSVSETPPQYDTLRLHAFHFYNETDSILSGLRAVVFQDGRGKVYSIIDEKNKRRAQAENELKNKDTQSLVNRVNKINADWEKNIEPWTEQLVVKRQLAIIEKGGWSSLLKVIRLVGTFMLGFAFLLREWHEHQKKLHNSELLPGYGK